MSTCDHKQLGERHAGQAGSHADAKVRYTMLAVLLVVSEPLTANALPISKSKKHTPRGVTRAMQPARSRTQQRPRRGVKWSPQKLDTVGNPTL